MMVSWAYSLGEKLIETAPTLVNDMPLMVQTFSFQVKLVVSPLERYGGA